MNRNAVIADILPKHSFWNIKMDQLDAERDIAFIVPRALYFTTTKTFTADIALLEQIYNRQEIIDNLKDTKVPLDNKVCELVANRYHIATFSRFKAPQKHTNDC